MNTSEYLIKKYKRQWLTLEELIIERLGDLPIDPDMDGKYSVYTIEKALLKYNGKGDGKRSKDVVIKEYNERLKQVFKDYEPILPIPISKAKIKELICEAYTGGYNRGLLGLKDYDLVNTLKKHGLA